MLSGFGLYTFYLQYHDLLGLVGAFMINLVMSVTFVFFYLARRLLCVIIFLFDCLYIYMATEERVEVLYGAHRPLL